MKLTIGIPTYNREEVLLNTLERILEIRDPDSMEVVVADQSPVHAETVARALEEWHGDGSISWIRMEQPSLTAARNAILEASRGTVVLFLDDDVLVPSHFFNEHLATFDRTGCDAVTGQVYNCMDHNHPPGLEHPEEGTVLHNDITEPCEANNISGGNHCVKREVAFAIGGYDEKFIASAMGEDMDFSQRIMLAGYSIQYNPGAWMIHLAYPTGGCGVSGMALWPEWTHAAGLALYAFRHGFRQRNLFLILWMAFRSGPARKEVLSSPGLWIPAWVGWFKALAYGFKNRKFQPSAVLSTSRSSR